MPPRWMPLQGGVSQVPLGQASSQASISNSRQRTARAPIFSDSGKDPSRILRYIVLCERVVRVSTSLMRRRRPVVAVAMMYPLISLLTRGYIRVCSFVRVNNSGFIVIRIGWIFYSCE